MKATPLTFCSQCVSMSTRPRIAFDKDGRCNACQWADEKRQLDWAQRERQLKDLLDIHRRSDGEFDCVVPVSGGKDGSYVAYRLKTDYGMNPLCATVAPPLPTDLGNRNLENFIASGFNHILITPHPEAMRVLNRVGFTEMGFPYYGWLVAIQSAVVSLAARLNVGLIFYGEDGEVEYGGTGVTKNSPIYDVEYMKRIYLEGGHEDVLAKSGLSNSALAWFRFPDARAHHLENLSITHWSYFENWDPYRNYLVAKEQCGLEEAPASNSGTFTNFAQNDQALYPLHTYLMYLKFGFGRANQDACIDVRRGALTREQAVNLVRLFDGQPPRELYPLYQDYYQLTSSQFHEVLDRWANPLLFEKANGEWQPTFEVS